MYNVYMYIYIYIYMYIHYTLICFIEGIHSVHAQHYTNINSIQHIEGMLMDRIAVISLQGAAKQWMYMIR